MQRITGSVGSVVAGALLCVATAARADAEVSIYKAYMGVVLAVGGLLLGLIAVLLIMCCNWDAATLRLQTRERRMWETAPSKSATADDVAVLESLHRDADAARKRRPKKSAPPTAAAASPASRHDTTTSPSSRSAGRSNGQNSRGGTSPAVTPHRNTEDDVVAFNAQSPSKVMF